MKTFLLGAVAVLGLAVVTARAPAAPIAGTRAANLLQQPSSQRLLVQVQHRPRHGGARSGGGRRDGGHRGGGDGAGAAAAGAAIGIFLGAMMAAEAQRQQAVEYCMRRFRSYDPHSMTYVGRDGRRHRCP